MDLTSDDIGQHVTWTESVTRVAEVLAFNPADDTEVLIRPASGGRKWVPRTSLTRLKTLVSVPQPSMVTSWSSDYDRLQRHVRELLDQLAQKPNRAAPFWSSVEKLCLDLNYRMELGSADPGTMAVAGGLRDDPIDLQDAARGDFTPGS